MVVQVLRREQSEHPSSLNLSMPDVGLQSICESTVGLQRLPEAGLDRRCAIFDVKARKHARPQISGKSFTYYNTEVGPSRVLQLKLVRPKLHRILSDPCQRQFKAATLTNEGPAEQAPAQS